MYFRENKADRTNFYFRWIYGWKEQVCIACNGSGRYDSHKNPRCGACKGTGKEKYRDPNVIIEEAHIPKYKRPKTNE